MQRKSRLDFESMTAVARLGAAECLASGMTTVADASFTERRRSPPTSSGYVRSSTWRSSASRPTSRRASSRTGSGSRPRSPIASASGSPRTRRTRARLRSTGRASSSGCPSRHTLRSPRRARLARRGHRADGGVRRPHGPTARRIRGPAPRPRGPPRALHHGGSLRHGRRGGNPAPRRARRGGRALSALERAARVWSGSRACVVRGRPARRPRHGQPRLDPRFDMFDEMRAAISLARASAADPHAMTPAGALRLATLGSARALASTTRSARSRRASAPTSASSRSPAPRSCPGRTPPSPWFSAADPSGCPVPSSEARRAS